MIDEKKLMKVIEVMVKPLTTPDGCGRFDSEIEAYNEGLIDAMEKVNEQPKVGEWIPCSERLPEEGAVVLVSLEKDEDYDWVRLVREGYYDEGYWFDMDGAHYGFEVLAWMPLPEPYKEDKE